RLSNAPDGDIFIAFFSRASGHATGNRLGTLAAALYAPFKTQMRPVRAHARACASWGFIRRLAAACSAPCRPPPPREAKGLSTPGTRPSLEHGAEPRGHPRPMGLRDSLLAHPLAVAGAALRQ